MRESRSSRRDNRRLVASVGVLLALCASVLVGTSVAVSADRGGVSEVLVLDEPDYGPLLVSRDLSTMVLVTEYGAAYSLVDLETGSRDDLMVPTAGVVKSFPAISSDGEKLAVVASWEGIEAGDADGGFDDGFLLDTNTSDVTLLTGTAPDSANYVVSVSGDASKAVLVSYPVFDGPFPSFSLWDGGALTPLTLPDSLDYNTVTLSADGSTLLYSRYLGSSPVLIARDLGTGDEHAVSGGFGYGYGMSDDGSTVAWLGGDGPSGEFGEQMGRVSVWSTDGIEVETYPIDRSVDGGPVMLSGDGATVSGTSYTVLDHETYETENTLWQLDVASGQVETLYTNTATDGGGGMYLLGVNGDGSEILFQRSGHVTSTEPFAIDSEYGGHYSTQVLRWSADGSPGPGQTAESAIHPALADQLGRLYQAYFGRAPDSGGLTFWLEERAQGRSLADVSQAFASSPEFADSYGDLDDEAFVELVYQNVLDRPADGAGLAYWTERLASGASRGWVMIGFSESPEYVAATGTSDPMSPTEAAIRRMYWVFLGREAADSDVAYWTGQIEAGESFARMADVMSTTDEYNARWGAWEFYEIFDLAIPAMLGRFPTDADYQRWWPGLESGELTVPQFLLALVDEPEVIAATGTTPSGG